jgi:hypothetical protein
VSFNLDTIQEATRTVVEYGILLPWEIHRPTTFDDGRPDAIVVDRGSVFIEQSTLTELNHKSGSARSVVLLGGQAGRREANALLLAGLAKRIRGGYHGTPALKALLNRLGWTNQTDD